MRLVRWLLLLLLLAQLPFAYQLCQTRRLSNYLASIPEAEVLPVPFRDVRGGIHVHSAQGGHSLGLYAEIVSAAKEAGYQYLFITEHPRPQPTLARLDDPDLVLIYGWEKKQGNLQFLEDEAGRLRILTHFQGESLPEGFGGVEIYNLHENGKQVDTWFNRVAALYYQAIYSDLFFFNLWRMDQESLQRWDAGLRRRPIWGFGGNDAHQNVGLVLQTTSGRVLASVRIDPYLSSFRFVTTHVLIPAGRDISADNVLEGLASGSAYTAFEQISDSTGFSFHAVSEGKTQPMGSQVAKGASLVFQAPLPARFVLRRGGEIFRTLEGVRFVLEATEPGTYRLEVYPLSPPQLLEGKPWILSNPIFVE